jgi:ubiquitin-protein ligase
LYFKGISFLFYKPGKFDPLNKDAAELMGKDMEAFKTKIRRTFQGGNIDGYIFLLLYIYI